MIEKEDLERFAGSSEEEEEENKASDDNSDDESLQENTSPKKGERTTEYDGDDNTSDVNGEEDQEEKYADESSDDSSDENKEDEDDFAQQPEKLQGPAGMADAMLKILGSEPPPHKKQKKAAGTGSAVLSRTVTPLQKAQQKEKEQLQALRGKRKAKASNPLPALHIPLSVATSMPVASATGTNTVAKELELERLHRRVATRGVVALFNAVAQHQKKGPLEETTSKTSTKGGAGKDGIAKMTKHGFLDMIKTAAVSNKNAGPEFNKPEGEGRFTSKDNHNRKETSTNTKWKAMQDDFMMNPKKVRHIFKNTIFWKVLNL